MRYKGSEAEKLARKGASVDYVRMRESLSSGPHES